MWKKLLLLTAAVCSDLSIHESVVSAKGKKLELTPLPKEGDQAKQLHTPLAKKRKRPWVKED